MVKLKLNQMDDLKCKTFQSIAIKPVDDNYAYYIKSTVAKNFNAKNCR